MLVTRRTVICKLDSRGRRRDSWTVPSQSISFSAHVHVSSCFPRLRPSIRLYGASILPLCTRRAVNTSVRGRVMLCLFIFRCTRRKKKKRKWNGKSCTYIFILYIRMFICHSVWLRCTMSVSFFSFVFFLCERPVKVFQACRHLGAAPRTVPNPSLYTRAPCPTRGRRDCKTQKGLNLSEPSSTRSNQSWCRFITE